MFSFPYSFVPNQADDLHCYQSAVRMVWEGLFGHPLSGADADRLTKFRAGQQTWPFSGMLALAEAGATVTNIEDFDPQAFITDPAMEIQRQSNGNEEIVAHVLNVSDVTQETDIVRRCLDHPRIVFDARNPSFSDLKHAVASSSTGVICNVNYRALVGKTGYNGHFVVIESVTNDSVRLHDPGLPPLEAYEVSTAVFTSAWAAPDQGPANLIVCTAPRVTK